MMVVKKRVKWKYFECEDRGTTEIISNLAGVQESMELLSSTLEGIDFD